MDFFLLIGVFFDNCTMVLVVGFLFFHPAKVKNDRATIRQTSIFLWEC